MFALKMVLGKQKGNLEFPRLETTKKIRHNKGKKKRISTAHIFLNLLYSFTVHSLVHLRALPNIILATY
jgi:hypothetical protein